MTALLQTTYFGPIQWYQKLHRYDHCLIEQYDSFQKQTYRNRCVIATANGVQALTVPVITQHPSPITQHPTPNTQHPSPNTHHPSPITSFLIDTPGIKGFGTFDMEPEELTSYFKEIFHFSKDCRFSNCTHTHEPGCAVLKALEDHYIAQSRYQSYLSMLNDKEEGKYREAY